MLMDHSTAQVDIFTPRLLIIACGNPSRGDDALGPLFIEQLEAIKQQHPDWQPVELLTDFQLHIEHAVDLENRELVLFVDASISAEAPYEFTRLQAIRDTSYTSHALSPSAVLHIYQQVYHTAAPIAFQLAIRGYAFELGEPLSSSAQSYLSAALAFTTQLLAAPQIEAWQQYQAPCSQ